MQDAIQNIPGICRNLVHPHYVLGIYFSETELVILENSQAPPGSP
jgi:hypothetical protein